MLLGFAAGVMLAASFLSLIIPGIEAGRLIYGGTRIAAVIAVAGILLGAAFVALLNEWVPHEHFFQGRQGPLPGALAKIWLFVLAITIHNLPEGLAVGVGFRRRRRCARDHARDRHRPAECARRLAVALALLSCGYTRGYSFAVASLTGLVEPVAGLLGAYAVSLSQLVLPWALTFAAGAMVYVISHEIIPETHRHGFENEATLGLTIGLVVMMFLDVAFASP